MKSRIGQNCSHDKSESKLGYQSNQSDPVRGGGREGGKPSLLLSPLKVSVGLGTIRGI